MEPYKALILLFLLSIGSLKAQQLNKEFLNYYNQEISCSNLQIDKENNRIYVAGKSGIYEIKDGIVKKQIFNEYARSIFYDHKNSILYSSKNRIHSKKTILHEELVKINVKTDSVTTLSIPIGLNTFVVHENRLLNYGRLANSYDLVYLNDDEITTKLYYTYLNKNNKLESSKKNRLGYEVDLRFKHLNDITYVFEGMYVNSQKNKLQGIYSFNHGFVELQNDFEFLNEKVIRSLNYSEGRYIATTMDSIFLFNKRKIISKSSLPSEYFSNKNQIPLEVFELDNHNYLIQTHEKNRYKYTLYELNTLTNEVQLFDDGYKERPSNLAVNTDNEKNIWVGNYNKGIRLYYNDNDNYLISHTHIGKNIERLIRFHGELLLASKEIPNFGAVNLKVPAYQHLTSMDASKYGRKYFVYKNKLEKESIAFIDLFSKKQKLPRNKDFGIIGNYVEYISNDQTYLSNTSLIAIIEEQTGNYSIYKKPTPFNTRKIKKIDNSLFISSDTGTHIFDLEKRAFVTPIFNNQSEIDFITQLNTNNLLLVRKNRLEVVNKLDKKIVFSTSHVSTINDILVYNNTIWIATNKGAKIYNDKLQEIRKIYDPNIFNKVSHIRENFFFKRDAVYMATDNGLLLIDVDKILQRDVKNGDFKIIQENKQLKISKNKLTVPHIYSFKYRIGHGKWNNYDNYIDLSNFNHGSYNIDFRYFNRNKWLDFSSYTFKITKEWYKRPLVLSLCAFVLLLLISIGLFLFAKIQNKRRKTTELILNQKVILEGKLNNIENSIAMDLHDNFGNRIAGISSIANIIKELYDADSLNKKEVSKFMNHMEISVRQLDFDIKDLIWSSNPKNNNLYEVANRINSFCYKMEKQYEEITIKVELDTDKNYILPKYWNRQIILIVKELVNNAIKFSRSKIILVEINASNDRLSLSCKDYGIGFDITKLNRKSGLSNIIKRAESLDCEIIFESEQNKGATVVLQGTIPLEG